MKRPLLIFLAVFVIFGYSFIGATAKVEGEYAKIKQPLVEDTLVYLKKLSVTGDFDGDGKQDTIYQNTLSGITHQFVDSFPASAWDSIQIYFDRIDADVFLTVRNRKCDTLHLGSGGGLYCLINMGDNNKDKKDEIALVLDNYSFTNISNCTIYSLCGSQWQELKTFQIHQFAFEYEGIDEPVFKRIKGFLESRKNKWFYIDYMDWFNAEKNQDTVLKPLKIRKCN
ncbi:hypothetical protein [Flavobacterium sp. BFFFF1]|uniref:hypothetical protein n=1 Tax=Flavobacterium sp. BFFFF1 TaxID=2015557 RepID=UPI0025BE545A|nr:hypothetical protein [Flavobacterium sp. BFFFF1]